jgi:hypothetical protein
VIDERDGNPVFDQTPRPQPLPEDIEVAAAGEAELATAQALRWHPHQVALRAWKLWQAGQWLGRTLTEERDRRMWRAEQTDQILQDPAVDDIQKAKRRKALRGHISRALLAEVKALTPTTAGPSRLRKKR